MCLSIRLCYGLFCSTSNAVLNGTSLWIYLQDHLFIFTQSSGHNHNLLQRLVYMHFVPSGLICMNSTSHQHTCFLFAWERTGACNVCFNCWKLVIKNWWIMVVGCFCAISDIYKHFSVILELVFIISPVESLSYYIYFAIKSFY